MLHPWLAPHKPSLLPNLNCFRVRLDTVRTEAQAHEVTAVRSWRANEALDNRGYPESNAMAGGKMREQTGRRDQ
ncbi:hypothetical protein [Paraburkholderia adhaesiva]|uniref:hypothetical protein n=1 Tax=Paraburkholderia adhaesiva TaxID=2883244 RepID=UPI001F1AD04D|nr:hypothetical protein [Paraburkholderia adhaesiva]